MFFDGYDIQEIIAKLSSHVDRLVFNYVFVVLVSSVEFLELLLFMGSVVISLLFPQLYQPLSPLLFKILLFVITLFHAFV